jgi:hypothetical protein
MNKLLVTFYVLLISHICFSQKENQQIMGIWRFVPPNEGHDSSWVIFKENKSLDIFYWIETKKTSIPINEPFTYYGFWDTSYYGGENKPKHISELKPIGRFIFFYDDLIHDLSQENKIGYDSLGNLYQPTRICDWGFINDGDGIEFNFGPQPDTYKRVDKIPDYVMLNLKKNNEHWQKYLKFTEHKESKIKEIKTKIHLAPRKPTKMYLIKGDEVEIIEEKDEWLKIRYYGKKVIEGWIKKSDVE